jgi:GNAT superfamily N-acetyltransferase
MARSLLRVPNVTIRHAEASDAGAIAHLLDQLGYPATAEQVDRRVARLGAADALFLAELDGEVCGLAGLHVSPALEYDGDAAKVSALVVHQDFRRRGIGAALMRAVEEEARSRGCVLLYLTTAERREDAHAFYRTIELEETGRRFAKRLE